MTTLLTSPTVRERNNGLFLVDSATELLQATQRHFRSIIVVEPAAFLTNETARIFRSANYALRNVRAWHQAIEWVERGDPEVILLDLDALDHALSSTHVSSHRLVALLRRAAAARPLTIAGVSQRDFSEMEEIMRCGLNLFVPRTLPVLRLIQRIDATRHRLAGAEKLAG